MGYAAGDATSLPRDSSYNRTAYAVYCNGTETVPFDCDADSNDTTNGQCEYMDDAGVNCYNDCK